jgi:hypothetical protein
MLNSRPQAFFDGDAMASEETRQRAAAPADTSLVQYRNDFFQREVRLLAVKGEICCNISPTGKCSLHVASVRKSHLRKSVASSGSQNWR